MKQRLWLAVAGVALGVFLAYVQGRKTTAVRSLPPSAAALPAVRQQPVEPPCAPAPLEPLPPMAAPWQPPSAEPVAAEPVVAPAVVAEQKPQAAPPTVLPPPVVPRASRVSDVPLVLHDSDRLWSNTFDLAQADSNKQAIVAMDGLMSEPSKGIGSGLDFNGKSSVGWKKPLMESDNTVFRGRFAGALSSEYVQSVGTSDDASRVPEVLFGLQFERRLDARNKILGEMEFGRDVMEFGRSRVCTKAAWEVLLDPEKNLSLRTGLQERSTRTSTAEPMKELDYTLDVIWKF
ncbi:MAG: hypothetical protein ABFC77_06055 [Thermoguttaceae bacterium]